MAIRLRDRLVACAVCFYIALAAHAQPQLRWDGFNNRLADGNLPTIQNDFGYRTSKKAGGVSAGEIGGYMRRSLTPASYSKRIAAKSLDDRLSVSGVFCVTRNEIGSGLLFGWFNDKSRGWRTPNSLAMRIDGNRNGNWIFFEYGTKTWKTGGGSNFEGIYQTTRTLPMPSDGRPHQFRFAYDPDGAMGNGELTLQLDGRLFRHALAPGHRREGAAFNRFGLFCQQISGKGMEVYFDDLELDGMRESFDRDPGWDAAHCTEPFVDRGRRPLQDFGITDGPTQDTATPIFGGFVWRDERPAYFARTIAPLALNAPFEASGRIRVASAASDSGGYFGWFNAAAKRSNITDRNKNESPKSQIAILIEGPSRDGHFFRPSYRTSKGEGVIPKRGPPILPDGVWHRWSLRYQPMANGAGRIVSSIDGNEMELQIPPRHRVEIGSLDRFGIFNHQTGGHYIELYLADLRLSAPVAGQGQP